MRQFTPVFYTTGTAADWVGCIQSWCVPSWWIPFSCHFHIRQAWPATLLYVDSHILYFIYRERQSWMRSNLHRIFCFASHWNFRDSARDRILLFSSPGAAGNFVRKRGTEKLFGIAEIHYRKSAKKKRANANVRFGFTVRRGLSLYEAYVQCLYVRTCFFEDVDKYLKMFESWAYLPI